MHLETNRLYIIACTKEHACHDGYDNGPHILYYLQQLEVDETLVGWGIWFVVEKESNRIIGDIGFKGKPDANKIVEVGYGFLEEYWNRGYATEAVTTLVDWAFQTSEVDRVIAETLHDNIGSIRVLEKLGMKRTSLTDTMINWELNNKSAQC
ncbi:GNAT family N-acetyltransferase [Priestia taiwanensis]|uniref:N-acetyltransferase n=1 Tax=Priestia taiwanensis TaxID=1347902 RepID=A0A917AP42_9BACI|nr:GNAT family N-acetyltransferase [Priestia taiwanensis]MBM7362500.1 ribosomal-protein-alanine N-acetyltransferase [Priestia taiwanensis]GGE62722.1 N-acetyltransferase [Priestia taiwanensis]